jgi:hypothetical protein
MILLLAVLGCLYTLSLPSTSLSIPKTTVSNISHKLSNVQTTVPTINYDLPLPQSTTDHNLPSFPPPTIGKVTASFGPQDHIYEGAITSLAVHNSLHNYPEFILRKQMVRGLWSKHAYLLTTIGNELVKPEAERLKWLFWHDRDTIVTNPLIPLELFLPPEDTFGYINLLVTRDRNGLNNGVFLVRVSQWAFKMFASALSIREYQPDIPLKYTEQSGMEETIKRVRWCPTFVHALSDK